MIFIADFLHFASSSTCQPLTLPAPTLGPYFGTGGTWWWGDMSVPHFKPPQISPVLAPGCKSPEAILVPSPEVAEGHL